MFNQISQIVVNTIESQNNAIADYLIGRFFDVGWLRKR